MRESWEGLQQVVDIPTLQAMNPYVFEHFIADLWREQGYKCYVRPESNDKAIDVIARKRGIGGKTVAIQVKRHGDNNDLGSPDIQQYYGMATQVGADESVVITTGYYTEPARDVAKSLGVQLINGEELVGLVRHHASAHFYSQYRRELGISNSNLQQGVDKRVSQPISNFASARVRNLFGKLLIACSGVAQSFATSVRGIRLSAHHAYRRVRGWDPRLVREREEELSRSEIAVRSATLGESLSEAGMKQRQTSWVNWQPSDRPILPTTGVKPSLRNASSTIARRRAWIAGLAAFTACCMLIISITGAPRELSGLSQQDWLIQCVSLAAIIGIGLPTIFYSQSAIDLIQFVYMIPASWPLVQTSGIVVDVGPVPQLLLIATGSLLFIGYPQIRTRLDEGYRQLRLPDVSTQLTPVLSPAVMLGLAGSGLTLITLLTQVINTTVLATSQLSIPNNNELISILLVGTGCIVLACIYQTLKGGIIGVVSIALAFTTGLGIGALHGIVDSVPSLQGILAMLAILTFVSLYILKQSSNRVLGTQKLLSILLLILLFGEYGLYPSFNDLFITPPNTTMMTYLMMSSIVALLLFSAIGWLEQRAIIRTVSATDC